MKLTDKGLFRQQAFINGQWVDAGSGRKMAVLNPSTGESVGEVPVINQEETKNAIEAAHAAWAGWRSKTAKERAAILRRWHDLILANKEDLSILMTSEQGKPLAESRGEIVYAASFYDLLSMLWWENYDSVTLQRRAAAGLGFEGTNSHYYAGIQSKLAKKPETTYHLGYGYRWNLNSGTNSSSTENSSSFDLRVGTYSHDFYGADNINFTLGAGYYYRNFHFDFSLNSTGMKLADSDYLFSISAGI